MTSAQQHDKLLEEAAEWMALLHSGEATDDDHRRLQPLDPSALAAPRPQPRRHPAGVPSAHHLPTFDARIAAIPWLGRSPVG